jgi:hypothetical protein
LLLIRLENECIYIGCGKKLEKVLIFLVTGN